MTRRSREDLELEALEPFGIAPAPSGLDVKEDVRIVVERI
jgi:hypothetical protein